MWPPVVRISPINTNGTRTAGSNGQTSSDHWGDSAPGIAAASPARGHVLSSTRTNGRTAPKTNSLLQLAESLQAIQPGLDRFIANRDKQVTEKQKVEAETMAGQLALQNQSDWNSSIQSVRKKLSDPNLAPIERERLSKQLQLFQSSNPWLRIYFDKAQLGQKALEFDQAVRTEWANNPVRDSDNPADFDTFFEERLNKAFESIQSKYHTRAFAEDFFPQAQKTRDALLNEHINYRQKQVIENAKNAFSSLATTKLNGFREALQTTLVDRALAIGEIETLDGNQKLEMFQKDRDALYQQWADDLSNEAKKAIQMTGGSGTEMNAILADSIIAVASEAKNPKILDLARYVTTRDKAKLSDIADIKGKLNDARRAINSERFTDVQREDALEERDRKEFLRKAQVEIFDNLHGDPGRICPSIARTSMRNRWRMNSWKSCKFSGNFKNNAETPSLKAGVVRQMWGITCMAAAPISGK